MKSDSRNSLCLFFLGFVCVWECHYSPTVHSIHVTIKWCKLPKKNILEKLQTLTSAFFCCKSLHIHSKQQMSQIKFASITQTLCAQTRAEDVRHACCAAATLFFSALPKVKCWRNMQNRCRKNDSDSFLCGQFKGNSLNLALKGLHEEMKTRNHFFSFVIYMRITLKL